MLLSSRRRGLDKRGQNQTEYGLILVLIGVALVATVYFIGNANQEAMMRTSDQVGNAGETQGEVGSGSF